MPIQRFYPKSISFPLAAHNAYNASDQLDHSHLARSHLPHHHLPVPITCPLPPPACGPDKPRHPPVWAGLYLQQPFPSKSISKLLNARHYDLGDVERWALRNPVCLPFLSFPTSCQIGPLGYAKAGRGRRHAANLIHYVVRFFFFFFLGNVLG